MKKFNFRSLLMMLAVAVVALTSCSKSSETLDYIPADADVVVSVNVRSLLENAGCQKSGDALTVQGPLEKLMTGADSERIRKFLEGGFFDLDGVFLTSSFTGEGYMLAGLNDEDALRSFLKENGMTIDKAEGLDYASGEGYASLFWNDKVAVLPLDRTNSVNEQARDINNLFQKANKNPMSKVGWKVEFLNEGKTIGAVVNLNNIPSYAKKMLAAQFSGDIEKILDGYVCAGLELKGSKAEAKMVFFDKEGEKINPGKDFEKYQKKIDTGLLDYLNSYDVMMAAGGIKGDFPWRQTLESVLKSQRIPTQEISMITPYLEALDGTVMFAGGPRNGMRSMYTSVRDFNDNWDVFFAAQLKDGMAEKFYNDLRDLVSSSGAGSCTEENGVMKIDIAGGPTILVKADKNNFIIANRTLTTDGGSSLKKDMVSGQNSVVAINLPKGYPVLQELGIEWGVRMVGKNDDGATEVELEIYGTDKPLLEAILQAMI